MSGVDFGARAIALRASAQTPRTFALLSASTLSAQVDRIDSSGHTKRGLGAASYVCDERANAALVAAHPAAAFTGAGGRHFRLLGTPDGFVTPEMFGCPAYVPGVNQQPYIQAAVDYAAATGLRGVYISQSVYELWAPPRMAPAGSGYNGTNHSGDFIVISEVAMVLQGKHGNRAKLHFKGPNGGNLQTDYQVVSMTAYVGDVIWRGNGIKMTGSVSASKTRPAEGNLCHLILRDLILFSDAVGVPNNSWPAWPLSRDPTGVGENCWDVSNKGIYCQADVHIGHLTVENLDVIGFLGECIYTPSAYLSGPASSRVVMRNMRMLHSNGQAINPNGPASFDIDGLYAENCALGIEGWGASIWPHRKLPLQRYEPRGHIWRINL